MNSYDRLCIRIARACMNDCASDTATYRRIGEIMRSGTLRERTAATMLRTMADHYLTRDGGPGSGNHGHAGRPGQVGGSGGGGGSSGGSSGSRKKSEGSGGSVGGESEHTSNKPKASRPAVPAKHERVSSKDFVPKLAAAKAACPPEKAWRVDASRTAEDFDSDQISTYATGGGSTFGVLPDGDIVSVCKNPGDMVDGKPLSGRDLMAAAVERGGNHLDSYSGNYEFYVKCGFETVSRCKFDERFAPPGWDKTRDDPEDIYFMRYVGVGKVRDASRKDMLERVPYSADYDAAGAELERVLKNGG